MRSPSQLQSSRTHVSTAIVPLATLRGDAGKLGKKVKTMTQSDLHIRHTNEQLTHLAIIWVAIKACAMDEENCFKNGCVSVVRGHRKWSNPKGAGDAGADGAIRALSLLVYSKIKKLS